MEKYKQVYDTITRRKILDSRAAIFMSDLNGWMSGLI